MVRRFISVKWSTRHTSASTIERPCLEIKNDIKQCIPPQPRNGLVLPFRLAAPLSLVFKYLKKNINLLRTFAPIATAHFLAHVTQTSCIADHKGKHDAKKTKGANIFHKNGT